VTRSIGCFVLLLSSLCASALAPHATQAQWRRRPPAPPPAPPGVEVRLAPFAPTQPPGDPRYLFTMELRATSWTLPEVVADRRLLRFEVTDPTARRPRPLRCVHPDAPRFRANPARARVLGGEGTPSVYREWIDLRMYCSGRALALLDRGAHVVAHYGYARAARGVWVARQAPTTPGAQSALDLAAGEFDFAARAPTTPSSEAARVSLAAADRATQSGLGFSINVRPTSGTRRVYLRLDQARFRIRGPLGSVECGLERVPVVPIVDFFRRVSPLSGASLRIDARQACPGAFPIAGIYEVTPVIELPHRFPGPSDQSLTGTFVGASAIVRIRAGERGYVEHLPEDLETRR